VEWVVKASSLCNLRCRYCYEWNHLADRRRLPIDAWKKLFHLAAEVAARESGERLAPPALRFVWHGGEPLLLGLPYFRDVLRLQQRILADHAGHIRNLVQTNLYSFDAPLIEHLIEREFTFGISFDHVPGVRLSAGGGQTETRVLANVERLRDMGARYAFIVVVAGHNVDRLLEVYRWAAAEGYRLRLLPLFAGPPSRPMDGLHVQDTALADGLFELFKRWFDDGAQVDILPFQRYLNTVVRRRLGLARVDTDAAPRLDRVVVVTPDERLFPPWADPDDDREIGRLGQSWDQIRNSESYVHAERIVAAGRQAVCASCTYYGPCSGEPLTAVPGFNRLARCPVEAGVLQRIDTWLDEISAEQLISEIQDADLPLHFAEAGSTAPP
jgi:uncharacterized protein